MKKLMIWLLAAALLASAALAAEVAPETVEETGEALEPVFDDSFDGEGYDGAWVTIDDLGVEFCLPEGWTEAEPAEGAAYRAVSPDGEATLDVSLFGAECGAEGMTQWAEAHLDQPFEVVMANGQEVAVVREDTALTVLVPLAGDVARVDFTRSDEAALSDALALSIAGSCSDAWY